MRAARSSPTKVPSSLARARERLADMASERRHSYGHSLPTTRRSTSRSWSKGILILFSFAFSYGVIDRLLQPSMQGRSLEAGLTSFLFTCAIFGAYAMGTGALNYRPLKRAGQRLHDFLRWENTLFRALVLFVPLYILYAIGGAWRTLAGTEYPFGVGLAYDYNKNSGDHGTVSKLSMFFGCWCALLNHPPQCSVVSAMGVIMLCNIVPPAHPDDPPHTKKWYHYKQWFHSPVKLSIVAGLGLFAIQALAGYVSMSNPWTAFVFYPHLHLYYSSTPLHEVLYAARRACANQGGSMCLSPRQWRTLSTNTLTSKNKFDVAAVERGMDVARNGLVINILAHNVASEIEVAIANVEALSYFVPKLTVVIFENDSEDETRQGFKDWSHRVENQVHVRYKVDLMECDEAEDCMLAVPHRYSNYNTNHSNHEMTSRISTYRNRILEHILKNYAADHSHMLIMDMDLGISIAPLGVIHTLGMAPNDVVAARGVQPFPGSLATSIIPYDRTAYVPRPTPQNKWLRQAHAAFCGMTNPGTTMRNSCDALSPFYGALIIGMDCNYPSELWPTVSSFNGGALYPLAAIVSTGARYDAGDDGERCEHTGFHLGITNRVTGKGTRPGVTERLVGPKESVPKELAMASSTLTYREGTTNRRWVLVNPRWLMHVSQYAVAGPTGANFDKMIKQITQEKNSPFVRLSVLMFLAFWPSHSLVFLFFGLLWEWLLRYKHTRKYAWRFRYFLQGVKTIDGKPIPGSPGALSRNLTVGTLKRASSRDSLKPIHEASLNDSPYNSPRATGPRDRLPSDSEVVDGGESLSGEGPLPIERSDSGSPIVMRMSPQRERAMSYSFVRERKASSGSGDFEGL